MKYFIILFRIVLGIVAYTISSGGKKNTVNDTDSIITKDQTSVMAPTGIMDDGTSSRYVYYASGILGDYDGQRRVLFFYASWCPTCQPVDRELNEKADSIPSNTVVLRVNYNDPDTDEEERNLAATYNIPYQHTFILLDQDGNVLKTWNGGGVDEVLDALNSNLDV